MSCNRYFDETNDKYSWTSMLKEANAFSPGHLTGFFKVCDQSADPLLKGSMGAGVSIGQGVTTRVTVEESSNNSVGIILNGIVGHSAPVSEHVVSALVSLAGGSYKIVVEHNLQIPMGSGFGSSGAGALSLALALNEVLDLNLSRLEAAQAAHVAEVECRTGLGTVIAETFGGIEIRVRSGAPGVGQIKSIPSNGNSLVACLNLDSVSTKEMLTDESVRDRINRSGGDLVEKLIKHPTTRNFMECSREFAEDVGLISKEVRTVLDETDRMGLTCSMAMFGETVFSVVGRDEVKGLKEIFSRHVRSQNDIILAEIDLEGARLI